MANSNKFLDYFLSLGSNKEKMLFNHLDKKTHTDWLLDKVLKYFKEEVYGNYKYNFHKRFTF